jgi:hypothetical protein
MARKLVRLQSWGLEKGRDLLQVKRQVKEGSMTKKQGAKLTRQLKSIKDPEDYSNFWFSNR